jgi:hypothetical protein
VIEFEEFKIILENVKKEIIEIEDSFFKTKITA